MSELLLCRICLIKDVKLFKLEQCNLKQYYEHITRSKIITTDKLPPYFCFECAALLHKYHNFQAKCEYGQAKLSQLFCSGTVTYSAVAYLLKDHSEQHSTLDYISSKCSKRIKTSTIYYDVETQNESQNSFSDKEKMFKYESIRSNEYIYENTSESDQNNDDNDFTDNIIKQEDQEITNSIITKVHNHNQDNPLNESYLVKTKDPKQHKPNLNITNSKRKNTSFQEDNISMDTDIAKDANDDKNTSIKDKTTINKKLTPTKNDKITKDKTKNDVLNHKFAGIIRKPKGELSKEHWDIKLLTEEEAIEQFKKKEFDSTYERMKFKCTKCFKGFSKNDMLQTHNKKWHEKGDKECRFCHMQYQYASDLRRHLLHHYYIYKCLRCGLQFNLKNMAVCHDGHHNGVIHKCKHCGEEYTHISSYYTHLRTWHASAHACALCGATFVSQAGVVVHMKRKHFMDKLTPESETNIYCQKCEISFVSQSAYNEHLSKSKMHEEGKKEPIKRRRRDIVTNTTTCIHCNKKFKSKADVNAHIAEEHPGQSKMERVVCEICGAVLSSTYIETHRNRHTKSKVFKCETCGKEFLCTAGYKAHLRTHTGERPYSCEICHKRFAQKGQKDIHYKRTHLKEPYPKRTYNRKNRSRQPSEVPLFTSLLK